MRVVYGAIALIAVVAGAGAMRANVAAAATVGIDPTGAGSAIPQGVIPSLSGLRLPGNGATAGNPSSLPKAHDGTMRVAQTGTPQTTGNPSLAPLKWVGRIVTPAPTQDHPNEVSECTGQFITPTVLLTAGHCLKDLPDNPTGPWFDLTHQTFTLQYQAGEGSHTFKTVCGATNPLWVFPPNYASLKKSEQNLAFATAAQHDYAMILVDTPTTTGVMPYALDWKGKVSAAVRVGYAGDILDDEIVQQVLGIVFFANVLPMYPASISNLVVHWQGVTDFTQGSSGGAWIANFNTAEGANNNILIAVTSFNNTEYPGAMFGAYLTAAEFNPLLTFVSNGCK